jgi:thiopeptide-type bacteriocin biosynthesis protein
VLARARWNLREEDLLPFRSGSDYERFAQVQRWRQKHSVPRWAVLVEADNHLPIDFENAASVDVFVDLVASRSQATVMEMLPSPDDSWASGEEGIFAHEVVIPYVRTSAVSLTAAPICPDENRNFHCGSEWLYSKVFVGRADADRLLSDCIAPLIAGLRRDGLISRWFFVRFAQPAWHVRLRFQGEQQGLIREVLPRLQAALADAIDRQAVWRTQIDVYEREVERYGGPEGITLAEEIFEIDSDCVLDILSIGDEVAERWKVCLWSFDDLLADMGFDLGQRMEIAESGRDGLIRQLGAGRAFERRQSTIFRSHRRALEGRTESAVLSGVNSILSNRSRKLQSVFRRLAVLREQGQLIHPLAALSHSYLHMHANRLLRHATTADEAMIQDCLARLYRSRLARSVETPPRAST